MARYLTRSAWGALPPKAVTRFPVERYLGIEAHHTVTSAQASPVASAKGIQQDHMYGSHRWRDIFYSFLVAQDGTVVEGRGWGVTQGPDTQSPHHRLGGTGYWLAVSFIGDYRTDRVTAAQHEAWEMIRRDLLDKCPEATAIRAHGDRAATACPGQNVRDFIRSPQAQLGVFATTFLSRGSEGLRVAFVQGWLAQVALVLTGVSPGPVDGIYGPKTEAAVAAFQVKVGLEPTGRWGDPEQKAADDLTAFFEAQRPQDPPDTTDGLPAPSVPDASEPTEEPAVDPFLVERDGIIARFEAAEDRLEALEAAVRDLNARIDQLHAWKDSFWRQVVERFEAVESRV